MGLAPGVRLGGYEILAPLGAGGMGEVYRAHDDVLGRDVAIKILPPQSQHDTGAIGRFFREARAASALNHPNIVTIHGAGQVEAGHFIVMELVQGRTLRALMGPPMAMEVLRDVGVQIARALATAHEAGIVHRDIKPENIMVRDDGYVKVLDFGLARLEPRIALETDTQTDGTVTRSVVGTLRYLSPERARGDAGGTATDVFSLGIVVYELASGRHPFHAASSYDVVLAILGDQPVPPSRWNGEVPRDVDALMLQMLDKDPARRPTAGDVARALAAPLHHGVSPAAEKVTASRHTVGRARERAELRAAFEQVATRQGQVICVAGEPGIGKSTLIEDFIEDQQRAGVRCRIARGRCSERLAGTEAYLPLLDALENLLRSPEDGSALARLLKTVAPLWHAQMALATTDVALKGGPSAAAGSQERLKRELVAFIEEAARAQPLVLFLDDVHWADVSTVDLLSYVASRFAAISILVVVTYRPEELLRENHPFLRVKQDLQARGCCRELRLEFLTAADVAAYLEVEFPDHRLPSSFVTLIHEKTEGNPLFMVDVLRYLRDGGVLAKAEGHWSLSQALPDIARALPESVRGMIERKIDGLEQTDRHLLLTASVQGYEFDAAVVAKMLRLDPADVEERLERLGRIHGFVRAQRELEYPDRTLTLRYQFVHVLYQNLLFATLTPGRRVALSKAVADALRTAYGSHVAEIAAELAVLYEAAREFAQAADHFLAAAKRAAHVFAYQEAILLAERGLTALQPLPDSPERKRHELALLLAMGIPVIAAKGYGHSSVLEVYKRAQALCLELNDRTELVRVLWGVWNYDLVALRLEDAHSDAGSLLDLAGKANDPPLLVIAHFAEGLTSYFHGDCEVALQHFGQAVNICDPEVQKTIVTMFGRDVSTTARATRAWAFWTLGYPDRALKDTVDALRAARALAHAETLAYALFFAAVLHQHRREWEQAHEYAEELLTVATDKGLAHFEAAAQIFLGLRLARSGRHEEGIEQMLHWLEAYQAIGAQTSRPRVRAQLAEQLGQTGRVEEALTLLADEIASTGVARFHLAELYRVQGDLLLLKGGSGAATEAESCLLQAIEVAREQQARSFELRAATSLCRHWRRKGNEKEARQLLKAAYSWFTEGFDTGDLKEAEALLEALSRF